MNGDEFWSLPEEEHVSEILQRPADFKGSWKVLESVKEWSTSRLNKEIRAACKKKNVKKGRRTTATIFKWPLEESKKFQGPWK